MLTDRFSRHHNYLRISVTDKCNLRCRYCMPAEGVEYLPHDRVLRNEEFFRLIRIFSGMGINKIRFTGGEPFVRKGFMNILRRTREEFGEMELCLTTNGILLEKNIDQLVSLNIKKLNISLDTLSGDRYREITGFDGKERVVSAILEAERRSFFDLKINSVIFRETIEELDSFLDFFREKNVFIRFIERMPFTEDDGFHSFVPSEKLIEALKLRGELTRNNTQDTNVAKMFDYTYKGRYKMNIGIIPPVTHKFCSRCNRLRLTADGMLKTCLHSQEEINLIDHLRNGKDDRSISLLVAEAVNGKKREHGIECDPENGGCRSIEIQRTMSKIGG